MFSNDLFNGYVDLSNQYPIVNQTRNGRPSISDSGLSDLITKHLDGNQSELTIEDIKWALKRFPELNYHIGALATFTAFTNQYPWVGKNVFGPGGISVIASPRLNQDEALIEIVNNAFKAVQENGLGEDALRHIKFLVKESADPNNMGEQIKSETLLIKELSNKLLSYNDIYTKLHRATESLIMYSTYVVDYSEDYSQIYFYSLDDLREVKTDKKDPSSILVVKETKKPLSERAQVIKNESSLNKSPVGRIVHYLRIIDVLETSVSVERLAKSNSFVVWKVGADGLPGEMVTPWLDVYKERVMTRLKAGTNNNNAVQASLSRSLTASHIFVPNYKDSPTEVDKIDLQYRPLLNDLQYWWAKVFMALGIPPYYSAIAEVQNIPKDITAFHEGLLGSRVRMYQSILEKTLVYWVPKFIKGVLTEEIINKYNVQVLLPTFVSGGEEGKSEYMRRVNQFASAYSTLSVSGLPITPDFAVKLMFPNSDPAEVVDWQVRKLMNPDSTSPYELGPEASPQEEEQYVDGVLNSMSRGVAVNEATPVSSKFNLEDTDDYEDEY